MHSKRHRNNILIGSLLVLLLIMGIGYAAFSTKLDIKGTTNISSEWSIKIISVSVINTNGMAESVKSTYTDLTANLEANLYNKGDYAEYKILVENSGDFDAKLDTLGITNSNNEAVKITASGFTKGQTLYKKTTKELIVKIAYNSNYEGDAGGTSGESDITLGFTQNEGGTITPTKDHLVTYDYVTNGGESTTAENEYLAEGSNINLSYTASKKNYEFLGWSQSASSKTPLTSLTMGSEDITLYAIFKMILEKPTITIDYDNKTFSIDYHYDCNSYTCFYTYNDNKVAVKDNVVVPITEDGVVTAVVQKENDESSSTAYIDETPPVINSIKIEKTNNGYILTVDASDNVGIDRYEFTENEVTTKNEENTYTSKVEYAKDINVDVKIIDKAGNFREKKYNPLQINGVIKGSGINQTVITGKFLVNEPINVRIIGHFNIDINYNPVSLSGNFNIGTGVQTKIIGSFTSNANPVGVMGKFKMEEK